ncbi:hypothetical protein DFH09DRAFT_1308385 [Mycena vulgaris]|nr:hypothetical protein DFH09DRAFT_1308385 [Mycena vulgaris]
MNFSLTAFVVSALLLVGMGHALPCELSAPYSTLETSASLPTGHTWRQCDLLTGMDNLPDGQGCKYVPEVCRGLPEQLLARCLQTFGSQLD